MDRPPSLPTLLDATAERVVGLAKIVEVGVPKSAALDVVFLHGLDGDARKTWTGKGRSPFWPDWLVEDLANVAVWSVGYEAWSSGWRGRAMPMQDRAINLMAELQNRGIGKRPLCFVTHSMGGLLAKEILLHAAEGHTAYATFATAARGVVFLGTPHTGSGLTKVVEALGLVYRATRAIEDLKRNSAHLRHLNDRYRDWAYESGIRSLVFFETYPTRRVQVVDQASANPGLPGVRPIPVDADHISICKPTDRDSLVYGQVRRFIADLLSTLVDHNPEPDSTRDVAPSSDIRKLREDTPGGESRLRVNELGVGWTIAGEDAYGHFTRRGRGQRSRLHNGDLFRGRLNALTKLRHLLDDRTLGRPIVVTGQPGAGKSALLARILLGLWEDGVGPGVAIHARSATYGDVVKALAAALDLGEDASVDVVLESLGSIPDRTLIVAVDALDEVVTTIDRQEIADLLADLAKLPNLRVAVSTRPLTSGDRYRHGTLLARLGISGPESRNLIDLDDGKYFDVNELRSFARAVLAQEGVRSPVPSDGAWAAYRDDPQLAHRVGKIITDRAGRNYLVAALACSFLAGRETALDPDRNDYRPEDVPTDVGDAIDKYLNALSPRQQALTQGLLTALAYARGPGIDDRRWMSFATALGYPSSMLELDALRSSPATDYLLETTVESGRRITRLFHQALIDELLARRRDRQGDEQSLLEILLADVRNSRKDLDLYTRTYTAEHAAMAGQLVRLIGDLRYLTVANLSRLLPLLPARLDAEFAPTVAVLRGAAHVAEPLPPARRALLFSLTAAHLGLPNLQGKFAEVTRGSYRVRWAHSLGVPHQQLPSDQGLVMSLVTGRFAGRQAIVCAGVTAGDNSNDEDLDHFLRVWDAGGFPLGKPLRQKSAVAALAIGRLDGQDVILSASEDRYLKVWSIDWHAVLKPLLHASSVWAVAVGHLGQQDVIVSGCYDGLICRWDGRGRPMGKPLVGHVGIVYTVVVGHLDGREVLVTGGQDDTIRLWDAQGRPLNDPIVANQGGVRKLVTYKLDGRDVIISGGDDGSIRRWSVDGRAIGKAIPAHRSMIWSLAVGRLRGIGVIASAGNDGAIRLWRTSGHPMGQPLVNNIDDVTTSVAIERFYDRDLLVSTDGVVRLWDLQNQIIGQSQAGHTGGAVNAVTVGSLNGRDVIVSGGDDGMIQLWNSDGTSSHRPLAGHDYKVLAVAVGCVDGRDVIVSGGADKTIRIWSPQGQLLHEIDAGKDWVRAVAVGRLGGRTVIVSTSDETLRLWSAQGHSIGQPLRGHRGAIWSLAMGSLGGRDVIVSGGAGDGTIRIWDAYGRPVGRSWRADSDAVWAIAIGRFGDRDVIVSGGADGTVRLWNPDGLQDGQPLTGHSGRVRAVAVGRIAGVDLIVSAGMDRTVQVWGTNAHKFATLDALEPVGALALTASGSIVAATHSALCSWNVRGLVRGARTT